MKFARGNSTPGNPPRVRVRVGRVPARGEDHLLRHARDLSREILPARHRSEDHHGLAPERLRVAVIVTVRLLPGPILRAGKLGRPGFGIVAVAHHHGVVRLRDGVFEVGGIRTDHLPTRTPSLDVDVGVVVELWPSGDDPGAEAHQRREVVVLGVRGEIGADFSVAAKSSIVTAEDAGEGEGFVSHDLAGEVGA